MKRFLITLLAALVAALPSSAGDYLKSFSRKVASSHVSFEYSFSSTGSVALSGSGKAQVQDDSFRLVSDGMEVCCDGVSRWSADTYAKELIVEDVMGEKDYEGNPALLVGNLENAFRVVSAGNSKFRGKVCYAEVLSPKEKTGLQQVKVYFDAKGNLLGVAVIGDGTTTEFVISSLVFSPKKVSGTFLFDTSILDSSWVVTDLR